VVGPRALGSLARELPRAFPSCLTVVVSDSNVAALHAPKLCAALARGGLAVERLVFPAGESSKSRAWKARLEDALLARGAGRQTVIVGLGGGVTGDLAGFLAATWRRGVEVVQAPTSLLAMADAALGGKTAVNLPGAKNAIGCFHQPWGVFADTDVLATLPESEYVLGLAEVVKTAAVADARFFAQLEADAVRLVRRRGPAVTRAIRRCMEIKGRIVTRDERDHGPRARLNFGHTVAHAIEAATGHRVAHGRAVALGLRIEGRLATESTGFPAADAARLGRLLDRLGLPAAGAPRGAPAALAAALRQDKKSRDGNVRLALPRRLGRMPAGDRLVVVELARVVRAIAEGA